MRKLVIGMALASTAIATPALARQGSWYVELDGGAMIVEDFDFDIRTTAGTTADAATLDNNYGYDFGGIVGYDFGALRLEVEASYRSADADVLSGTVPGTIAVGGGAFPTSSASARVNGSFDGVAGDANALSFMLNGLLDFGPDDGLQGFVGGGLGIARISLNNSINAAGPGFLDDSDSGFAWQAIAGVRAPLNDNWDVGLKYRFFNANNIDLIDQASRGVSTRWRSHSILGTLSYNFGGAEAAPPPPPPPPPAPPPPPPPPVAPVEQVCNKGPYIVFFDWDKSLITPEAATILDSAVSAYANCARVPIMLAGYTDRSGSNTYNQALSERRNSSVREYLSGRGIPNDVISSQGFGESNPRVPTADGVRELQNRRVEITYGPGSGF